MEGIFPNILVIEVKVNDQNISVKRQRTSDWRKILNKENATIPVAGDILKHNDI